MGEPYLSEIRLMAFGFAPKGWAQCNGQTVPIQQYQALFALLGTTYGGNGVTTFNLPDLRGRAPLHYGPDGLGDTYVLGQVGGEPLHSLSIAETPTHTHTLKAANVAADTAPAGVTPGPALALAQAAVYEGTNPVVPTSIYSTAAANATMAPSAVGQTGGQPHENRQPFLVLNYCIALSGIFPSQN
ncbi:MAG TPA: tail fiber protein [Roseiarcus sp.]|nr:tail fiber protein [Roseiarcus sp.]